MLTPTTSELFTAIEVLRKLGLRINEHAAHSVEQCPTLKLGDQYAGRHRSPKPSNKLAPLKRSPCSSKTGAKNCCNKGGKMCRNPFKREEAEPLRYRRILRPPILRRFSGGNDAAMPTAIRWAFRRMTGGIAEIHSAGSSGEIDGQSPGNCREVDRTLPGICPANIPDISAALPAGIRRHHRRRLRAFARLIPVL